ncbi:MAG: DNA-binding response regulator [Ardenticatenia bacterium]|uniref:Transcriptional regulator n=1 Tax=Ardenticatena maritima TaxID=872965 RepID=A0A0M9UDU7_9CHLR|nr:response regulator transcription factor [Ardenticatena maritima]KPL87251.1 transcriptional regulator [Ardenticatena maritima]RME09932.1 MAG: DNA-binding response regulator [Ardenticatenia bacterium]GAP64370.1 two-component system, OmpR family, response regulator MprA [Ardenticatena maritima]
MAASILIIEDDAKISEMLRRGLLFEGYRVETAPDGPTALEKLRQFTPDLIILDWMLPGMDGLEVLKRIRAALPDVPVLMLTAKDSVADRVLGLESGADDYLVKPFAFEELLARIHALLRRRQPTSDQGVLRFADLTLDTNMRIAKRGDRVIELTPTEYELLEFFMRNPRQVLPRDLIYERVWGYDFSGESNLLDVYVRYLRNKLEAEGEPRLIHTVRGVGYILREPDAV